MSVSNVLLVDRSIRDYNIFVSSVNESTIPILYSKTTTREELLTSLSAYTSIDRIAIAFSNDGINLFLENQTFFDNMNFIVEVIQQYNVKNIDYLGCNTLNLSGWKEYYASLFQQTGVIVGASSNQTGNLQYGGDWILENTGQDIELIYFTKSIEYYKYLLDTPEHSKAIIIKQDNTLYGAGDNSLGDLGLGYSAFASSLTLMPTVSKTPLSISCGMYHTVVLMTDGTIYGTGNGNYDKLANIGSSSSFTLMTNSTGKTPKAVSCGHECTIVLMTDNTIYGVGLNQFGELANITSGSSTLALMTNSTGKTPLSISCGARYTIVLMTDGTIYGTGYNGSGQLGIGNTTNKTTLTIMTNSTGKTPAAIACGDSHTIVLMTDGTIYGTGYNGYGQLGIGNTVSPKTTLQLMTNSTGKTPAAIACGAHDTIVTMSDGYIYSVGKLLSDIGIFATYTLQLITNSTGKTLNSLFPIVVSKKVNFTDSIYFVVVMTDNSLYGMGSARYLDANCLGLGTSLITNFVNINVNKIPKYVSIGNNHSMVLMTDKTIYGTGMNDYGQLGIGNNINQTSFTLMTNSTGKTPTAITCGNHSTMVLMSDGTIYGIGYNGYVHMPDIPSGSTTLQLMTNSTGKTPLSISCGAYHTIVLMTDGTIYGTGNNGGGQLGIGNTTNETTLTIMTNSTGKTPLSISCGANYTIVLMTDKTIYGTGMNNVGQLGLDNTVSPKTTLQLMTNSTGKTPLSISCGAENTIVLMTDGTIYGTGLNNQGQLGIGNYDTITTTLSLMTNSTGKTPLSISRAANSTFVLMTDGTIYGTGNNTYGQLGLGNTTQQNTIQLVPNLTSVNKLSGSDISIVAIPDYVNNGNLVCFKQGSLILTDKGYVPIQDLRKGDLVQTLLHGVLPIDMIGKRDIFHVASTTRIKDQLYECNNNSYPEVFEPLVITGCHSILINEFFSEQHREEVNAFCGGIYITNNQYRLPACIDERAKVYDRPGTYTIYHIALENVDYYTNYGVYANGLLVETCSKRYLKELSNMEII